MMICFVCDQIFLLLKTLIYHLKHEHGRLDKFNCKENNCKRSFSSLNSFRKHIVSVHASSVNSNNCNKNSKESNKIEFQISSEVPTQLNANNSQEVPSFLETLTTFHNALSSNHNSSIIQLIANLYNNSLIPRSFVQEVIDSVKNIFCSGVISDIKRVVSDRLQSLNEDPDIINTITSMFETIENSFNHVNTEYKRLQCFKSLGQYVPPRSFVIGQRTVEKRINGNVILEPALVFGQIIEIRQVLSLLF